MRTSLGPRLALSFLAILWTASAAPAQDQAGAAAALRLVFQTAWTTPEKPVIRITLRITNVGATTIADPVVGWTLGPRVTSRVGFETAIDEGPAFAASANTVVVGAALPPGASTDVPIRIDVEGTSIEQDDSAVYPLELELRSEDLPIASVTTAAIHIFQDPVKRVRLSWWTEVATPLAFGPDGTLIDPGFEAMLRSGGGVVAQVEAIADRLDARSPAAAMDVIVSPAALDQLRQAADGYERSNGTSVPEDSAPARSAAQTLRLLREIAADPAVRLHAMPFAAPRLPALLSSGLGTHLEDHWRLGDEAFVRIIGESPDAQVVRPPGLAIDQDTIDLLSARGVSTVLGAADTVQRPSQANDFAPPPATMLSTSAGGEVALLLPDPGTQALLGDVELLADPVRAAQVVLGELATIWKEKPVPPPGEVRGLALDLEADLPPAFWAPALLRISNAPFLQPMHAEDLPFAVEPAPGRTRLVAPIPEGFSSAYADDLATTGRRLAAFAAILEEPSDEADRLRRALLYAEASQYVDNEGSGRAWIEAVDGVIDRAFARLAPDTSRVLTFTSRSGTIPLRMGDPGRRVVNLTIELASGRVEFLGGNERAVRLDRANQVVTFQAEVKAAGRSRIDVFVLSPNGAVLSRSVLVVSSTAINPIALLITIGAGLVLVALWSRRLLRRRTT